MFVSHQERIRTAGSRRLASRSYALLSHIEKLPETQWCMLMALYFNNGEPAGVLREIHHGEIHHKPEAIAP